MIADAPHFEGCGAMVVQDAPPPAASDAGHRQIAGSLGRVSSKNEAAAPSQPRDFEIDLEAPCFLLHSGFARLAVKSRHICRDAGGILNLSSISLSFVLNWVKRPCPF